MNEEKSKLIPYQVYISPSNDPYYNLALEDYLLRNLDTSQSDYLLLYQNTPSVVVGRNQNIFEELNLSYCKEQGIEICRRISGGGTVFHDMDNLNWTIISSFSSAKVNVYTWAAEPVLQVLKSYNLTAYLTPRNAIEVDGWKLSGQAQFTNRKNILSHGTLLVNSQLSQLQPAIEKNENLKIISKAAPSVRSRTKNLADFLAREISVKEVIDRLLQNEDCKLAELPHKSIDKQYFKSFEWLWARCPKFDAFHVLNNEELKLRVEKGIIVACENKKGYLVKDSLLLNQTYENFLLFYS